MSGSREESPDWLRSFQAPTLSMMTLSSDSDSEEPSQVSLPDRKNKTQGDGDEDDDEDDGKVIKKILSEKHVEARAPKSSVWELSSDTEEELPLPKKEEDEDSLLIVRKGKSPTEKSSKGKPPRNGPKITGSPKKEKDENDNMKVKGNDGNETVEEDAAEKRTEPHPQVSTSTLPLVLSEKVQRAKALVECEGESIDLSGDMGAVGRIVIPDTAYGSDEMYLDLKGTIYKTTIVPSRTFCVVSFGQSEAKIEAIMNDFIQLKPLSNVYEAETMVEGTLDGFSFDSEDDADKIPKATSNQTDQNDGVEVQNNCKVKKKAEKPSGTARKRGTGAGGKSQPPKKVRKKTVVSKKGKAKK